MNILMSVITYVQSNYGLNSSNIEDIWALLSIKHALHYYKIINANNISRFHSKLLNHVGTRYCASCEFQAVGVLCSSLFWYAILYVLSSAASILTRKGELIALLLLSFGCLVTVGIM